MERIAEIKRKTAETDIRIKINLDGIGSCEVTTGIPFFDHMLTLFSVHGFFDLTVKAIGDIDIDYHHTIEDIGIVLGDALNQSLGDRKGIARYGHAVTPMDDALSDVVIDLSNRPFLIFNTAEPADPGESFNMSLVKEFFRAFSNRGGLNLHINNHYGENEHHIIESIFKAVGRALDGAVKFDDRITKVLSSKGKL